MRQILSADVDGVGMSNERVLNANRYVGGQVKRQVGFGAMWLDAFDGGLGGLGVGAIWLGGFDAIAGQVLQATRCSTRSWVLQATRCS